MSKRESAFSAEFLDLSGLNEATVEKNLVSLQWDNSRHAINFTCVLGVLVGGQATEGPVRRKMCKRDLKFQVL